MYFNSVFFALPHCLRSIRSWGISKCCISFCSHNFTPTGHTSLVLYIQTINSDIGNEEGATGVKPFTAAGIVSDLDVVLENLRSGRNQDAQVGSPEEHHASGEFEAKICL